MYQNRPKMSNICLFLAVFGEIFSIFVKLLAIFLRVLARKKFRKIQEYFIKYQPLKGSGA